MYTWHQKCFYVHEVRICTLSHVGRAVRHFWDYNILGVSI